jgi:serine protease AprX
MNGDFTLSAIAADIAARKGMLPVIAAGNEGTHAWHYISTPGDADSVMTVGAVDTLSNIASFSSYGPASDGRVKPNIAATGLNAVIASPATGQPTYGNGTSFATPNIAGLTTCLWQAFPEYNNMAILDAIQRSGTRYNSPNDRIGYGIPDMKKAFVLLLRKSYAQQVSVTGCTAAFQLTVKEDNSMNVVVERKQSSDLVYSPVRTIAGTGDFTNKNLTFAEDLSILQSAGTVSYRIRLDIASDTTVYLDSLTVNIPENCVHPVNSVDIKPNPVNDVANIVISRATTSSIGIMMINAAGQRVYETSYAQAPGTLIKTIDMSRMSAGIYYVTILAEGKIVSTKRILKR